MRKGVKRILLLFAVGFIFLFIFRLAYGYHTYPFAQSNVTSRQSFDYEVKNYASSKIQVKGGGGAQISYTVDQKYEKIATLSTES